MEPTHRDPLHRDVEDGLEIESVHTPYAMTISGFDLGHYPGLGEFREACETGMQGRANVNIRRALTCTRRNAAGTDIYSMYVGPLPGSSGTCEWTFRHHLDPQLATDDVIGEYFREAHELASLRIGQTQGAPTVRALLNFDGSGRCWEAMVAGDFDCVRRGYASISASIHFRHRGAADGNAAVASVDQVVLSIRHSESELGESISLGREIHVSDCLQ